MDGHSNLKKASAQRADALKSGHRRKFPPTKLVQNGQSDGPKPLCLHSPGMVQSGGMSFETATLVLLCRTDPPIFLAVFSNKPADILKEDFFAQSNL